MNAFQNSSVAAEVPVGAPSRSRLRWPMAVVSGTVIVALSGQVALPVPFSPVPMTLQGLAVLVVGGLFGGAAAAGSMVLYLALGAFGLPVFAAGGAGLARLFGPTGGYLLAFPLAALVVARLGERGRFGRSFLAALLGMIAIHLGGWAWLAILFASPAQALAAGVTPFLAQDLLKMLLAAGVLWRGHHALRPGA